MRCRAVQRALAFNRSWSNPMRCHVAPLLGRVRHSARTLSRIGATTVATCSGIHPCSLILTTSLRGMRATSAFVAAKSRTRCCVHVLR